MSRRPALHTNTSNYVHMELSEDHIIPIAITNLYCIEFIKLSLPIRPCRDSFLHRRMRIISADSPMRHAGLLIMLVKAHPLFAKLLAAFAALWTVATSVDVVTLALALVKQYWNASAADAAGARCCFVEFSTA